MECKPITLIEILNDYYWIANLNCPIKIPNAGNESLLSWRTAPCPYAPRAALVGKYYPELRAKQKRVVTCIRNTNWQSNNQYFVEVKIKG